MASKNSSAPIEALDEKPGAPATSTPAPSSRTKPGYRGLFVSVSDALYEKLEKTADGRPLNVWLSRLIERADFAELNG